MRRGVLNLGILGGVGAAQCPWRVNSDGSLEWEDCSVDCPIASDGHGNSHDSAVRCTVSGADPGKRCAFPFKWKNVVYNECTYADHDQLWCATKVRADGSLHEDDDDWGNCGGCYRLY